MKNKNFKNSPAELYILYTLLGLIFISAVISFFIKPHTVKPTNNNISAADSAADSNNNESKIISNQQNPDPDRYKEVSLSENDLSSGNLVLINNDVSFNKDNSDDFVNIYDNKNDYYYLNSTEMVISKEVINPLNEMIKAFYEKTELMGLNISSSYRSYEQQRNLYEAEISQKGEEEAKYWVSKPGSSEHHSGLAIDFSIYNTFDGSTSEFNDSTEFSYLSQIAPNYGFIVRYKDSKKDITKIKYEPWHFRFVGLPHSLIMEELNLCFEEYIEYLKEFSIDKDHLFYRYNGKTYEIYYQQGFSIYVPKSEDYEISGNNLDGFIITICK